MVLQIVVIGIEIGCELFVAHFFAIEIQVIQAHAAGIGACAADGFVFQLKGAAQGGEAFVFRRANPLRAPGFIHFRCFKIRGFGPGGFFPGAVPDFHAPEIARTGREGERERYIHAFVAFHALVQQGSGKRFVQRYLQAIRALPFAAASAGNFPAEAGRIESEADGVDHRIAAEFHNLHRGETSHKKSYAIFHRVSLS